MELVFASANAHKVKEVAAKLGPIVTLLGLGDIGCTDEIPETGSSLQENALQKAMFVSERYNVNCFADDTGLEVSSLEGLPGVHSARYAGLQQNSDNNIEKLLSELKHQSHRNAKFRTVICLILNHKTFFFEGIVYGKITRERRGNSGFGYDPVFLPDTISRTMAEINLTEKNLLSHRAKAIEQLQKFLLEAKF